MRLLTVFLAAILLLGCSTSEEGTKKPVVSSNVEIKYAENFLLNKNKDNSYTLDLLDPGTKEVAHSYRLIPGETERIISLTSTLNGMLAILNEEKILVGISDVSHIYDKDILALVKTGKVREYGDQSRNSLEKIVSSKASIVFYDIVDSKFPNQEKLKKFGVQVMPIYDWRENHPLAKAEWIKVVGVITGKIDEANAFFEEVEMNYKKLKKHAAAYDTRPSVFCGNLIGDIWYTPSGDNYYARLIKDAGGNYKYNNTPGTVSLEFSIQQVIKENKTTDIWLNPGFAMKDQILKINPHAHHFQSWKNNTYCYSFNMKQFWEESAARPDLVLKDLMTIFHPEDTTLNGDLNYYKKVD
jgi:iron complex transport system substrate-binding protein